MRVVIDKYCIIRDKNGKIIDKKKVIKGRSIIKMKKSYMKSGVLDTEQPKKVVGIQKHKVFLDEKESKKGKKQAKTKI